MKIFCLLFFLSLHAASETKIHALRLSPGQDVRKEIEAFVIKEKIQAGSIISAVGSLTEASLRYANKPNPTLLKGHFEVLSLSGTVAVSGSHLHMSIADGEGKTVGGHLSEGSKVFTTLELVLASYSNMTFERTTDKSTGYKELEIKILK